MIVPIAAIVFSVLTGIVILFQASLAFGAPWGKASMGGKYPGKYPPKMRVVAFVNMLVLGFMLSLVLARSGFFFNELLSISRVGIWFVVAFLAVNTVMNTITPSKIERIWAPVTLLQCISALLIAW